MTVKPPPRVSDPAVWKSAAFPDESSWTVQLTDSHIMELESAAERIVSSAIDAPGFSQDAFALPTLGSVLADQLTILEHGRGFFLLRGLDVDRYDPQLLRIMYWGICSHLGTAISQNTYGELMSDVTDHGEVFPGEDPYRYNIRAHRTAVEISPHTDSCDHVALMCVRPAQQGGGSAVVSALAVYNEIAASRPDFVETLSRGFFLDLVGKGTEDKQLSVHRIPVFSYFDGKLSARFNKRQIELGAEKLGGGLDPLSQAAIEYIQQVSEQNEFRVTMEFRAGDIQVLNNRVIFHSRESFMDDADKGRKRLLWRVWLSSHQPRPLAPEFADQLNSGRRGGVTKRF